MYPYRYSGSRWYTKIEKILIKISLPFPCNKGLHRQCTASWLQKHCYCQKQTSRQKDTRQIVSRHKRLSCIVFLFSVVFVWMRCFSRTRGRVVFFAQTRCRRVQSLCRCCRGEEKNQVKNNFTIKSQQKTTGTIASKIMTKLPVIHTGTGTGRL
jgi:hypothetical protein